MRAMLVAPATSPTQGCPRAAPGPDAVSDARGEALRGGDDLDVTAMRIGHEADQALRARCAESLPEWIAALRRLREDPKRFGLCEGCGRSMPWERIELLPTARSCAGC